LTHAQPEDLLTERPWKPVRSLFQDHLDLRASREQRLAEGVAGADDVVRRTRMAELAGVYDATASPTYLVQQKALPGLPHRSDQRMAHRYRRQPGRGDESQ
jgi:hypothetical protein